MDHWFLETVKPMLEQLAEEHHGYPAELEKAYFDKHVDSLSVKTYEEWVSWPRDEESVGYAERKTASDYCSDQWGSILKRMAFLLGEANEETCSLKNPYEKELFKYREMFEKKYPNRGDELKTEEELERDRTSGSWLMVGPERDPVFGEKYAEVREKYFEHENKIFEYRNQCKNEFFELFSRYFWDLWD